MRSRRGKKQLLTLLATVVVVSSAGWHWLPRFTQWYQSQLAIRIAHSIEQENHSAAIDPLYRLADLGTPAINALVFLASSQRNDVAQRARQVVDEKFSIWRTRAKVDPTFDIATPTTALATAIAGHANRFDSLGKRWATSLAVRLVDISESLSTEDATKLLGESNRVLAAIPPQGPRLRSFPEAGPQPLPATASRLSIPDIQIDQLAVPSENAQEIFSPDSRLSSPGAEQQIANPPDTHQPFLPEPTAVAEASIFKFSPWSPQWNAQPNTPESTLSPLTRVPPLLVPSTDQPKRTSSEVVNVPTPLEMKKNQNALRKMSSKVLIARLPQADRYDAGSIRVVLRQRGFTEAEWALAKLFSSPRVADRNQLVEAVSTLPADNTRRWLRWLLKDNAAEVRLHALTALATTNDPQLFHLAREIAVADQDARVSELASRIMRQVRYSK